MKYIFPINHYIGHWVYGVNGLVNNEDMATFGH